MNVKVVRILAMMPACAAMAVASQVDYDSAKLIWSLKSGPAEYRLQQQKDAVRILYMGPVGGAAWPAAVGRGSNPLYRYEIGGMVEGESLAPEDLTLLSQEILEARPECAQLRLVYQHKRLPLKIEALYTAWGDTGVFTRRLILINLADHTLHLESVPSLSWCLPPGEYNLDYLYGMWGEERQLGSEKLGPGRRAFVNSTGRSTDGYSPWFSLRNQALGVRYAAQLAYSGNWEMFFERHLERRIVPWKDHELKVQLGLRNDFGGAALVPAGASFVLPEVAFTASTGDLDDIANQLHRYQWRYVVPHNPSNTPLLTQFNVWYALQRTPTAESVKRYADYAAAFGLEAVIIDAGWFPYVKGKPDPVFGDWWADPVSFPKGLKDVADYVHARGMKFGVWLEIECASSDSRVVKEHPDWVLTYQGAALPGTRTRVYLNFGKPEVRRWARTVVDRLVRDEKVDWFKLDYNVDLGENFDPPASGRSGTVLYDHLHNYLAFLDEIRKDYPKLMLENCSSGGLRMDLAIAARTDTTWVSDVVEPHQSVQLAYGCTMEFTPQVCNHWAVGNEKDIAADVASPPGWWDFLLRVPMNGQYGISTRVADWSPEMRKHATDNVAIYKRLRQVIAGADVYHLTPPPAAGQHPTGWMALEYVTVDASHSVVMTYRLEQSAPQQTFHLRGLDHARKYRVSEDGRARGVFTGAQLADDGLAVTLADPWRAAIFEVEVER